MTGTSGTNEGAGVNGISSMSAWTGTSSGARGAGAGDNGAGLCNIVIAGCDGSARAGGNGAELCDIVIVGCGGSTCFTKTGMLLPVAAS